MYLFWNFFVFLKRTHYGLVVLGKGVLDKHGSECKAQSAVRVTDAHLPARGAALWTDKTQRRSLTRVELCCSSSRPWTNVTNPWKTSRGGSSWAPRAVCRRNTESTLPTNSRPSPVADGNNCLFPSLAALRLEQPQPIYDWQELFFFLLVLTKVKTLESSPAPITQKKWSVQFLFFVSFLCLWKRGACCLMSYWHWRETPLIIPISDAKSKVVAMIFFKQRKKGKKKTNCKCNLNSAGYFFFCFLTGRMDKKVTHKI